MRERIGSLVLVALAFLVPSVGQAAPPVEASNSYRDFIFLGSERPVLLRLHLVLSGRSYEAPWQEFMDGLFQDLDVNEDGFLDKTEAGRIPRAEFLNNQIRGVFAFYSSPQIAPLAEVDADRNNRVSREELAAYYGKANLRPFRFEPSSDEDSANRVTARMFKYLDANEDSLLSSEELANGRNTLRQLDLNEDELITSQEILGVQETGGYAFRVPSPSASRPVSEEHIPAFLEVLPEGKSASNVVRALLLTYDRDRDVRISAKELGLAKQAFQALDSDSNDLLDGLELQGFLRRAPDLEMKAIVGELPSGSVVARLLRAVGVSEPTRLHVAVGEKGTTQPGKISRSIPSALVWNLGDAEIEIQVDTSSQNRSQGVRRLYLREFNNLAGKDKTVEEKKALPNYALRGVFKLADRNSDKKLTEKELLAYLDIHDKGATSILVMQMQERGRNLFTTLDASGEGSLSARELLEAGSRLKLTGSGKTGLARSDIPRRFRLVLGQGQANYRTIRTAQVSMFFRPPVWFQNMDRNRDGDVSRREFLGSEAEFQRLDQDRDQLISSREARRAGREEARGKR
jgi:Ca2+-binding EF-hand superfamily protein